MGAHHYQPRVGCVHIPHPCLDRGAVRELHARPGLAMAHGPVMMMLMMTMVPLMPMIAYAREPKPFTLSLRALSVLAVTLDSPRHVATGFHPPAPAGVQCIGLLLRPVYHFPLLP